MTFQFNKRTLIFFKQINSKFDKSQGFQNSREQDGPMKNKNLHGKIIPRMFGTMSTLKTPNMYAHHGGGLQNFPKEGSSTEHLHNGRYSEDYHEKASNRDQSLTEKGNRFAMTAHHGNLCGLEPYFESLHEREGFNKNLEKNAMDTDDFLQQIHQYGDILKTKINEGRIDHSIFRNRVVGTSQRQSSMTFQDERINLDNDKFSNEDLSAPQNECFGGLKETRRPRNIQETSLQEKHGSSYNNNATMDQDQCEGSFSRSHVRDIDVYVRQTSTGKRVLRSQTCNNISEHDDEIFQVMEEANNNHAQSKKKRVRWKTSSLELRRLRREGKIEIQFNIFGNLINRTQARLLASRMGSIVRNSIHAPLHYTRWNCMPTEKKEHMLQLIQEDFIIFNENLSPEERELRIRSMYRSLGKSWREFKIELYKLYMTYANDEESIRNCPSNVTKDDWEFLIKKYWKSDYFKATSNRNKFSRSQQSMPHCTGRTRFSVIEHEDTQDNNGVLPSRLRMFGLTRTRKTNKLIDKVAKEKMAQISELQTQCEEGIIELDDEGIYTRVFGPERPGHIRMRGSSVGCPRGRNLTHAIELEKYKNQAEEAKARAEQAEKVAALANEKAEKAHANTKKLFALLQSRMNEENMEHTNLNEEMELELD